MVYTHANKGAKHETNLCPDIGSAVTGFVRGDASVTREQDPLTVNSKTIALKLENPRVRVLEATIKPGDKEQTHSHPAYVIYVIAGGKFRNHAIDGPSLTVSSKPATSSIAIP